MTRKPQRSIQFQTKVLSMWRENTKEVGFINRDIIIMVILNTIRFDKPDCLSFIDIINENEYYLGFAYLFTESPTWTVQEQADIYYPRSRDEI